MCHELSFLARPGGALSGPSCDRSRCLWSGRNDFLGIAAIHRQDLDGLLGKGSFPFPGGSIVVLDVCLRSLG